MAMLKKDSASENCTLKLLLYNVTEDSREEHDYTCQANLDTVTVSEVKRHVEKKYQIPECGQTLYFEFMALGDKDTLGKHKLRDGDSITVKYSTVADVEDINELVAILEQLIVQVEAYKNAGRALQLLHIQRAHGIVCKSFQRFSPRCTANQLTFVHKGGVATLYKLYSITLKMNFNNHIIELWHLETVVIKVVGSVLTRDCCELPLLKKHVLTNQTLDYILTSLTRVMMPSRQSQEIVWLELHLKASQAVTLKLALIEEYQLAIASNEKVIQQILHLAEINPAVTAIITLENLSENEDAHVYLSSPQIINKVLSVYENQQQRPYHATFHLDLMLLRSIIGELFSELVCKSANIILLPLKCKICQFMEDFLNNVDHSKLGKHREQCDFYCPDLLPTISLPYSPMDLVNSSYTDEHNLIMKKLEQLCVEIGVLCIQAKIMGENERKSIIAKKLVDYVVCLPWHVTAGSRAHRRACDLVAFMSENMVLQPPSLINIARAKLAATHLGLKKTLKLSVHEIATELLIL